MFTRLILAAFATSLLVPTVGCHRWCRRDRVRDDPAPRTRIPSSTGPGIYLDEPVPTAPGGGGSGGDSLPPPVIPDSRGSFRIEPTTPTSPWDPAPSKSLFRPDAPAPTPVPKSPSGSEFLLPESSGGSGPPSSIDIPSARRPVQGYLGEPVRPPQAAPSTDRTPPPSSRSDRPAVANESISRSPVGLPGFTPVPGRPQVASGGKPTLDGFDRLKANGYRTVVYLHAPGTNTTAARDLAEARGLKFVPIAVSPGTLRKAYETFAAAVEDRTARPVYVADADGGRAGPLWYLLFRTADLQGDDVARIKAAPLGLGEAVTEEQKQFWIAIQDFLANR